MANSSYNRYKNLHTFATEWRNYKSKTTLLSQDVFRNTMQTDEYVRSEYANPAKSRDVLIYLFEKKSKYTTSSNNLKLLLKKIKTSVDVILVTYEPLNTYGRKVISSFRALNIYTYLHEIFDLIVPKGPLCYPHRRLSREEVLRLCNSELYCNIVNLPKILDEDPQCIWIGAEVGDVIEITSASDIACEAITYRVVIPKNGRTVNFATTNVEEINVEDDDEVLEHREDNVIDDSSDEEA